MTEQDDIKVHDVVRRKIPWFREVVGVVRGVYDTNILIPTLKTFSLPKKSFLTSTMAQNPAIMTLDVAKYILLPRPPTPD
jgi:hypothetical protein